MRIASLAVAALLAGCTGDSVDARYPALYQRALDATSASAEVPKDAAARFVAFFESIDQPGVIERVDAIYGTTLYFSDTLFVAEERAALEKHFERLQASGVRIDVDLDDAVISGRDLYLRWRMRTGSSNGSSEAHTIGMTQLRFDETGRISLHQDFWDSSEGVYRRVPVLGAAIRFVDARIAGKP